LGEPKSIF